MQIVTFQQLVVVAVATAILAGGLLLASAGRAKGVVDLCFIPIAFVVNILGWAGSVWLYVVYYGGAGDSIGTYYGRGLTLYRSLQGQFSSIGQLLLGVLPEQTLYTYDLPRRFLTETGTWYTVKLSALLMTLVGPNFLYLGYVFTLFGFLGALGIYKLLADDFPAIKFQLGLCFMFIPSFVLYGSGLMKEPICTFGNFLVFNFVYRLAHRGQFSLLALGGAAIGAHLLLSIKSYIFLAFAPGLLLWLALRFASRVENLIVRAAAAPVLFIMTIGGLVLAQDIVAAKTQELALDQVAETISSQTEYWNKNATSGSSYTLPNIDFTPAGLLADFPSLYMTGAFRPYLWDSRSVIILLAALESTALLCLVFYYMVRHGFLTFWRKTLTSPMLVGFFVFSFIFFPVVALTSGNFGTLIRYRLPALPFFLAMFVLSDYLIARARSSSANVPPMGDGAILPSTASR